MADVEYIVSPEGELDIETIPPLREQWLRAVDEQQPDCFVVDLRRVTFLDSSALSAMVAVGKRQREHGGDIVVTNANHRLSKIFRLTGLDGVLKVNHLDGHADTDGAPGRQVEGREAHRRVRHP